MITPSYQVFDFARLNKPTDYVLSMLSVSASYVLHVIARLDAVTTNTTQWPQDEKSKVFANMKEALRQWIVRKDVIGGSMFGGSIPQRGSRSIAWKDKGKKELQVCIIVQYYAVC